MSHTNIHRHFSSLLVVGIVILAFTTMAGCDKFDSIFEVENPGNITDVGLETVAAISPLTAGVGGDFATAIGGGGSTSFFALFDAMVTDDAQHVGSYPTYREVDDPLPKTWDLLNTHLNGSYQQMARARWVADAAIERVKGVCADTVWGRNANVASIYVYAGYAYAWLADLYDGAPIDGGPKITRAQLYQKAIERFTQAVTIGTNASNAALPGRVATSVGSTTGVITAASGSEWAKRAQAGLARVYHITGNIAQAKTYADLASPVGQTTLLFNAVFSLNSTRENNMWYFANLNRNEVSVSPDARALYAANPTDTRIRTTRATGSGGMGGDGNREWWVQYKYTSYGSLLRVAGWQEMELIRAEAAQKSGDLAGAIAAINRVRAAVSGLAARASSSDANQVLDWIKYERRAEFFWEGRRMADLRYFGETAKIKATTGFFPIPSSERDTNPNPMD
jgi:hypothetical protein